MSELCGRCGAPVARDAYGARLCPRHLREAREACPPFACSFEGDDPLAAHLERELAEQQPPVPVTRIHPERDAP